MPAHLLTIKRNLLNTCTYSS